MRLPRSVLLLILLIGASSFIMDLQVRAQPPAPHGIAGTIYHSDGTTQVPLGTSFQVNDSTSGDLITGVTSIPVPGFSGRYSVSIDGNDGDQVIVWAWNTTDYGQTIRILSGDMVDVDVVFNLTRPPEPNITIIFPPDDIKLNASIQTNITANISWFGGAGTQCNATLSIVDPSVINATPGDPLILSIGTVNPGDSQRLVWNLTTGLVGSTDMTVTAQCLESTILLEANGLDTSMNLTVIDSIPPNVTLLTPDNQTVTSNKTINFVYLVNDTGVGTENCSLIIDSVAVVENLTINEDATQHFFQTFSLGTYTWQVQCYDLEGNLGLSETRELNVTLPDLYVNISLIRLPKEGFQEKENITFNVTIMNIGTADAQNVTVQFLELTPVGQYNQLGDNRTINLTAGEEVTLRANHTTQAGLSYLIVRVDPPLATNGSIQENNESNNQANLTIDIPIWQIFYGDVANDIVLGTNLNISIIAWFNASYLSGNLYVIDSDASISWSGLQALSRNSSGSLRMDDFTELDGVLNTSHTSDTINLTYTAFGAIRNTSTYTVYDTPISDVPQANSTNNTNFMTGILWDTTDGLPEYDGSQDVVFVTKVTATLTQGAYGLYNYEVRIPANLEILIQPSANEEVTFYVELD